MNPQLRITSQNSSIGNTDTLYSIIIYDTNPPDDPNFINYDDFLDTYDNANSFYDSSSMGEVESLNSVSPTSSVNIPQIATELILDENTTDDPDNIYYDDPYGYYDDSTGHYDYQVLYSSSVKVKVRGENSSININ